MSSKKKSNSSNNPKSAYTKVNLTINKNQDAQAEEDTQNDPDDENNIELTVLDDETSSSSATLKLSPLEAESLSEDIQLHITNYLERANRSTGRMFTAIIFLLVIALTSALIYIGYLSNNAANTNKSSSNNSGGKSASCPTTFPTVQLLNSAPFRSLVFDTKGITQFDASGLFVSEQGYFVSFQDIPYLLSLKYFKLAYNANMWLVADHHITKLVNGKGLGFDTIFGIPYHGNGPDAIESDELFVIRWPDPALGPTAHGNTSRRSDFPLIQPYDFTEEKELTGCPINIDSSSKFSSLSVFHGNFVNNDRFWALCTYPDCVTNKNKPGPPTVKVILPLINGHSSGDLIVNGTCANFQVQDKIVVSGLSFNDYTYSASFKSTIPDAPDNQYKIGLGSSSGDIWIGDVSNIFDPLVNSLNGQLFSLPVNDNCDPLFCNVKGMAFFSENVIMIVTGKSNPGDPASCYQYEQGLHIFTFPLKH